MAKLGLLLSAALLALVVVGGEEPDGPRFKRSYSYSRKDLSDYMMTNPKAQTVPDAAVAKPVIHPDSSILTNFAPFNRETSEESLFLKWIGSRAFNPAVIEVPLYVSLKLPFQEGMI